MSRLDHLSDHWLSTKVRWSEVGEPTGEARDVGFFTADLAGGEHGVSTPWQAKSAALEVDDALEGVDFVQLTSDEKIISLVATDNWGSGLTGGGFLNAEVVESDYLSASPTQGYAGHPAGSVVVPPTMPTWRCETPGKGTIVLIARVNYRVYPKNKRGNLDTVEIKGSVAVDEPVDCVAADSSDAGTYDAGDAMVADAGAESDAGDAGDAATPTGCVPTGNPPGAPTVGTPSPHAFCPGEPVFVPGTNLGTTSCVTLGSATLTMTNGATTATIMQTSGAKTFGSTTMGLGGSVQVMGVLRHSGATLSLTRGLFGVHNPNAAARRRVRSPENAGPFGDHRIAGFAGERVRELVEVREQDVDPCLRR